MSEGLSVIVCIPPSFCLDEIKHHTEENGYDWDEIKERCPDDYQIVLDKLMIELKQTGRVTTSDEDEEELIDSVNNLAGILVHLDFCMGYYEIDSASGGCFNTSIVNCYDDAKKIIYAEDHPGTFINK